MCGASFTDGPPSRSPPTALGETQITAHGRFGAIKRLTQVRLGRIRTGDVALARQAQREKLVTVQLGLSDEDRRRLGDDLETTWAKKDQMRSDDGAGGMVAPAWRALRAQVVAHALDKTILPALRREVEQDLEKRGREHASTLLGHDLWRMALQAPIPVRADDQAYLDANGQPSLTIDPEHMRVAVACYGDGHAQECTTFVMLDKDGLLLDFVECPQLSGEYPTTQRNARGEEVLGGGGGGWLGLGLAAHGGPGGGGGGPGVRQGEFLTDHRKAADLAAIRYVVHRHLPARHFGRRGPPARPEPALRPRLAHERHDAADAGTQPRPTNTRPSRNG